MTRLATKYLGLDLRSPLVASAGPLTRHPDHALRLQQGGAAAIVLPSLFEEEIVHEQLELDRALETGTEGFAEALNYFPDFSAFETTTDHYLGALEQMKTRLDIPVIASLNASSPGGWVRYARMIEEAGADALELNLYRIATEPALTGAALEANDLAVIREVRDSLTIPLAVKISPYYSTLASFAKDVVAAGANGLVLFNRFYQPELDVNTREIVPRVELSQSWELRLPVMWTAILRSRLGAETSLAASTGVHTAVDAAKALLAGADVAMMTSAILLNGPSHFAAVERDLLSWMDENEYESVGELRGSASYLATDDPSAFERANYVRTLHSWSAPELL
ncbi:MAG: dihydroorotate dehydrogenase-like protein [Thermoleophilia bacterium]